MEPSNPSAPPASPASPSSPSPVPQHFRILEFYSGIGGMRYSLIKAGISGEVVEAFDINDTANDVYHHNFAHRPFQGNIQTLTVAKLDEYGAHAWLLSPPCQPYTRQGLQKHSADARAFSFVKILELIRQMLHPPLILFVENVVGFETSDTHEQMKKILAKSGFVTQEYILSPLQFGIPYSRPRYFCLAKRNPLSFWDPSFNNQLLQRPPVMSDNTISMDYHHHSDKTRDELSLSCEPIRNFLEPPILCSNQLEYSTSDLFLESNASSINPEDDFGVGSISGCEPENTDGAYSCNGDSRRAVEKCSLSDKYAVPHCLIERWGRAMDIVYPDSKRCCCFTKSYYRYVKGTGSLLATSELDSELAKESGGSDLNDLRLRYFMPREVANLHSFPESFQFPPHLSLRQQYALLGNSLSVSVVASLLQYLFAEP